MSSPAVAASRSDVAEQRRRLRVLHTLPAPDGSTRFVDQMIEGAAPGVEIITFSWRRAILGRYDVLHVHWPEYLVRHPSAPGRVVKRALALVLLARLRLTGVPIVRTAHNLEPHEGGGRIDRLMLRTIDARTTSWIRLNPTTPLPAGARVTTVLHGHYRGRYPDVVGGPVPGRLLQFGLIRPYKGIERLLATFAEIDVPDLSLRIVGKPVAGSLGPLIVRAAQADPRISHELSFVSDAELAREVTAAELVVLPYREMHNSGALLVALSLDRPVVVPRSDANEALAAEVGEGWLHLYDGELSSSHLLEALSSIRSDVRRPPDLAGRDWDRIGAQLELVYREALDGSV